MSEFEYNCFIVFEDHFCPPMHYPLSHRILRDTNIILANTRNARFLKGYNPQCNVLQCSPMSILSAAIKTSIRSQDLEIPSRRKACRRGPDSPGTKVSSTVALWEIFVTNKQRNWPHWKGLVSQLSQKCGTICYHFCFPVGLVWFGKHRVILVKLFDKPVGDIMPRVDPAHVHNNSPQLVLQRGWLNMWMSQPEKIY